MRRVGLVALLGASLLGAAPPPPRDQGLLDAMREELGRAKDLRLPRAEPPYFLGYWVADRTTRNVEATLGALVSDSTDRRRFVKVDLRVGDRRLDNSSFAGGSPGETGFARIMEESTPRSAPIDDDPAALRHELWLATDSAYKSGVEILERKRANQQNQMTTRPAAASFSDQSSVTAVLPEPPPASEAELASLVVRASAEFRAFPVVQRSEAHAHTTRARRRFVSTDGGLVVEPASLAVLELSAETQAKDGMPLQRSALVPAKPGGTIGAEQAMADARRIGQELTALADAPVMEDYTGPVLFEGAAAAQLVYDLLGDSLSGTPPPGGAAELEGPLARRVGKRVLPRGLDVVDDPSLTELGTVPLLGHYAVDDEGISAERTQLVEDGYLRALLMSRSPREGQTKSNGHGRSGLLGMARGRPGNLIVKARRGLSRPQLRQRLLSQIREERAPYGLVVRELSSRTGPTSGQSVPPPELVFRVTPDGRETLVRGATVAPVPLRLLRDVIAGKDVNVSHFVEESENGLDLAVSVAAPSLLFDDLELRGPSGPNKRPPIVPRPPRTASDQPPASLQQRTPSE